MPLNFEPVPYEEAARIVAEKQVMPKAAFDALCDELKARAFTVAGLEDLRMVQEIRDAITEIPMGAAWEDVKKQVADKLEQGGFSEKAADYRATLLLRHHGFAAYAQEHWRVLQEDKDVFPYWKYLSMGDEKVRSSHAALNGLILPADDPFWRDHYPPWEWNCRCQVVGVTQEEYDAAATAGTFDSTDPEAKAAGWKLPPAALDRLHDGGQLDDGSGTPATVARTSSFHFDPSGPGLDMAEIEKRYDPADWAAFKARMEAEKLADGRSVWEWANGVKGKTTHAEPQRGGGAEEEKGMGRRRAPSKPEKPRFTDPVVKGDPVCDALGCRKGQPFSIEEAAAIANPQYAKAREYQINCQRCVTAYELLRRGYHVEALPWKRGAGDFNSFVKGLLGTAGQDARQSFPRTLLSCMREIKSGPVGARYSLRIGWRNAAAAGHFIVAERTADGIRFVDPQNPAADVRGFFQKTKSGVYGLLRLDNRDINFQTIRKVARRI